MAVTDIRSFTYSQEDRSYRYKTPQGETTCWPNGSEGTEPLSALRIQADDVVANKQLD